MHYFYKILNFFQFLYQIFNFESNEIKNLYPNHSLKGKLIVSFTSKRDRFKFLYLMINSVFNQSILPDQIILWIENKDRKYLNNKILSYKKKGLTIMFCKNFKYFNKIIHTLKFIPKSFIITLDDDIIYDKYTIEYLVKKSKKYQNNVIANRIHKIRLNKKKYPMPYKEWVWNSTNSKSNILNFQTGVYGVLYPPNCFFKDVVKEKIFTKLSPYADDIWLYWMIRMNKKCVIWSGFRNKNYEISNFDKNQMRNYNVSNSGNDKQINKLIKFYGFPK